MMMSLKQDRHDMNMSRKVLIIKAGIRLEILKKIQDLQSTPTVHLTETERMPLLSFW